ncbi:hypothetical protein [Streptomyces sp. JJ36]|uniref:hypothetical protein n=1 Tax=Streptomyces sp. JJ36 TaxID=2736645 RepID=UPI001F196718|nr:hypothetical protein [Streptomyces sp. JJ36]MCF6523635.1 hypothetical protein [Streptomyces sp. JJ36]
MPALVHHAGRRDGEGGELGAGGDELGGLVDDAACGVLGHAVVVVEHGGDDVGALGVGE